MCTHSYTKANNNYTYMFLYKCDSRYRYVYTYVYHHGNIILSAHMVANYKDQHIYMYSQASVEGFSSSHQ